MADPHLEDEQKAIQEMMNMLAEDSTAESSGEMIINEDDELEIIVLDEDELEVDEFFDGDDIDHYDNIADYLSVEELEEIGTNVVDTFESDDASRKPWLDTVTKGLNLTGLRFKEEGELFRGQCTAHHPLIMEAVAKFQAKEAPQLLDPKGPVKTMIIGEETPEKNAQATRARNFMNFQVLEEMSEYSSNTERMLFYTPLIGSGFKKTYQDAYTNRPTSVFVGAEDIVVPYSATDIVSAERISHRYNVTEYEMTRAMLTGAYSDLTDDLDDTIGLPYKQDISDLKRQIDFIVGYEVSDLEEGYEIIEQHCYLDLPEPFSDSRGMPLPYVVIVERKTGTVLSIRKNWNEEDENKERKQCFTHYQFVPGMGFYGLGYIHLLGNFQMTLTTIMRSLVDAGQFANLPAGFKSKQMRTTGNDGPLGFGEFKEVDVLDGNIRDHIMPVPFKEPSPTLFNMLQALEVRGQKFADSAEQVIADASNEGPVGTTIALLEESNKFTTAIHRRLFEAQKQEFRIIAHLNSEFLDEEHTYLRPNESLTVMRGDFANGGIDFVPVSDPNAASNAQKIALAQTQLQAALQAPDIHDRREAYRALYIAIGLDENQIVKLLPPEEEAVPSDPMTDIMNVQNGKPIKAFEGQDHQAHITVKQTFLMDPMMGGNELMASLQPKIAANIQEHIVLQFKEKIDGMTQENAGSAVAQAQAAQQIATQQQQLAQIEAQGGLEDPKRIVAQAERYRAESDRMDKMNKDQNDKKKLALQEAELIMDALMAEQKNESDLNKEKFKAAKEMISKALDVPPQLTEDSSDDKIPSDSNKDKGE